MKFIAISDTHGCHRQLNLPDGDVLLHSGDVCDKGNKKQVEDFINWLTDLDYQYKIIIRGNHDMEWSTKKTHLDFAMPDGIFQLKNSGMMIGDTSIWGIPSPLVAGAQNWKDIPANTQILMTHEPPYSILDRSPLFRSYGDNDLLEKVKTIEPRIHLFGHIHAGYGQKQIGNTLFINGSLYKASKKKIVNEPFVFEM